MHKLFFHLHDGLLPLLLVQQAEGLRHRCVAMQQRRLAAKGEREIKIGRYQYENVEIHITSADNNSRRQIAQIDSLVSLKVDLLVVAPNDIETVAPAIERAYRSGIPVVLYDRRTDSPHFTAYIGSDNVEVGKTIASFVASKLNDKGTILEITASRPPRRPSNATRLHAGHATSSRHEDHHA
jgi:ABC-type xylose transport system substrate-binding protein